METVSSFEKYNYFAIRRDMFEEDSLIVIAVWASNSAEEVVLVSSSYYTWLKGELAQAMNEYDKGFFIFREQIFDM
jgi:hypothetical protein